MPTKVIVYSESKSKDKTHKRIYAMASDLTTNQPTIKALQMFAGSLVYSSIFLVPNYDLEDGRSYTIENVCYCVNGLYKVFTHDLLHALANMSRDSKQVLLHLETVLKDQLFYEVFSVLGLDATVVYRALLHAYNELKCVNLEIPDGVSNLHILQTLFMETINV